MRQISTTMSNGRFIITLFILFMEMLTANLDITILAAAIPKITEEFNALADIGWYGSATFLTIAAFQTTWGKIFKYFNLKWSYALSIVIFQVGSIVCAVAQNSTTFIVGRAVLGLGASGVSSGSYIIISYTVIDELRPAFIGCVGATYALACFLGPIAGGAFAENVTWRWCFWINLPIGGLALALLILFFRNPEHAKPVEVPWKEKLLQLDPVGSALILSSSICYLLALQWGGLKKSWSDSTVIGTLVGFVLLAIACGVNEALMGERASIVPRILRKRRILVNMFFVFLNSGGQFILVYYIPIYFQSLRGDSPLQSAVHNLPFLIGGLTAMVAGALLSATNQWIPFLVPAAVLSAVGGGLMCTLDINTSTAKWIGYQLLASATTGFVSQIPMMANTAIVDLTEVSSTSAMTLLFQLLSGSFSVSAAQSVFGNLLLKRVAETAPDISPSRILSVGASDLRDNFTAVELPHVLAGYREALEGAFAVATALMAASVIASLFFKWERLHPEAPPIDVTPMSQKTLPADTSSEAFGSGTLEVSNDHDANVESMNRRSCDGLARCF